MPVDLGDRDVQPVADHDVLDAAGDPQPTVAQLREVAGAEPVVVAAPIIEGAGVVVGVDVAEEEVRAADAALGRIDA